VLVCTCLVRWASIADAVLREVIISLGRTNEWTVPRCGLRRVRRSAAQDARSPRLAGGPWCPARQIAPALEMRRRGRVFFFSRRPVLLAPLARKTVSRGRDIAARVPAGYELDRAGRDGPNVRT